MNPFLHDLIFAAGLVLCGAIAILGLFFTAVGAITVISRRLGKRGRVLQLRVVGREGIDAGTTDTLHLLAPSRPTTFHPFDGGAA